MRQLLIVLVAILATLTLRSAQASLPIEPPMPSGLGLGVAWQQGDEYNRTSVELLQPAIWCNWKYEPVCIADSRCVPMAFSLRDDPYSRTAMDVARANPGRLWLLGNEPDAGYTYTDPVQAAEFTRLWADEIGGSWACCGVMVWPTEWRPEMNWQTWMDAYLAAGGVVGTHWHIHIYGVTNAAWYAQVQSFRAWAIANDVDRPIIVSETNAYWTWMPYNVALLDEIAHRLDTDPMLHSVMWYSVHDYHDLWPTTDLRDEDGALTVLGERFVELQGPGGTGSETRRVWIPLLH